MRFILLILLIATVLPVNPADSGTVASTAGAEQEGVFVYDDHGNRDPFWPLVSSSGAIISYDKDILIADMVLEGIMTEKDGNNIAIINGIIVKSHDKIGVFLIKKIDPDLVILEKGQQTFMLKLLKEE